MSESGHISIHTENILPIIKKWLYSEKEIFVRELISNAADAITKLSKLALMGDVPGEVPEPRIDLKIDKDKSTITISDTGLGMTADEIKKYINQVAFSGVQDFVERFEGKEDKDQVIGHFGLGFYSSFMVSSKVEIVSKSYQQDAEAAHWTCEGSTEFHLSPATKESTGTDIILHIDEENRDLLNPERLRGILDQYCAFVRYPIYLEDSQVNETRPAWSLSPSELKDEDYKALFAKLFPMASAPLFWIHLNVDYPFNLRGVLFFPKLEHEMDASEGEIKLFCNQVYVADNPKELIPDFLVILKGVIDCPDLPLNVSRSYLQNDPQVRKIREHISKKIADKLAGMAKVDREKFLEFWPDIHTFIKYGMMRDEKFYDRMKDHLVFRVSDGSYKKLSEYKEQMGDKTGGKIIYASDPTAQASMINLLKKQGIDVIETPTLIDRHFLPYVEMQSGKDIEFQRIDSGVLDSVLNVDQKEIIDPKDNKSPSEKIKNLFSELLDKENTEVEVKSFKDESLPGMLVFDENQRRFQDFKQTGMMGALAGAIKEKKTLVVNSNSEAVKNLLKIAGGVDPDRTKLAMMVQHIYDLAYIQQGSFDQQSMQAFIERSSKLLSSTV